MAKSDWLKELQKQNHALVERTNPYREVLRSRSPSLNFCFAGGHGLPLGKTLILYGPPKGGKSVVAEDFAAQCHLDYEDGFVVKFDVEFRDDQFPEAQITQWGIDLNRFQVFQGNRPEQVFDVIENSLGKLCKDGMPLKMVIIDSITSVRGRRSLNAKSVTVQQQGDEAATIQDGLKRIVEVQRKYRFGVIIITQLRAERDEDEIRRGHTEKMAGAFALKHCAEYFLYVAPNNWKDGRQDLDGNALVEEGMGDIRSTGDRFLGQQSGHRVICEMRDSTMGGKGRRGEFTIDYKRGIVNVHEEVFLLAKNRGLFEQKGSYYEYDGKRWNGQSAILKAIEQDPELQKKLLVELRRADYEAATAAWNAGSTAA